MNNIGKKDLIDSLVSHGKHLFQSLLGHLHDLLECAVQLHLSELVRVFDHSDWLICPLLVEECLRANLLDPLGAHLIDVDLVVLPLHASVLGVLVQLGDLVIDPLGIKL